ncbi:DUF4157 domain-containing protein [Variovorax sp. J22R24]|uniref:eCIS core domain-containing protein n=1 Tax=Variovorax gracilis TaxID=3053502 RepID=UPI00257661BE|nr:DUF4157 domain-containing protein [Variovorax sp. J22R24]MDM0109636.1 DUF4157 domain-containing protein [Variovorax sp. J22R24]
MTQDRAGSTIRRRAPARGGAVVLPKASAVAGSGVGNLDTQRSAQRGAAPNASSPRLTDRDEAEANHIADRALQRPAGAADAGAPLAGPVPSGSRPLAEPGSPLPGTVRRDMEPRFGADLGGVRIHAGSGANQAAEALGARAFTLREHIVFGAGSYDPAGPTGRRLLAHELAHVMQGPGAGSGAIRRETAQEIKDRYMNFGGLNLQEEELGAYLTGLARGGQYTLVTAVIDVLDDSDTDDVAGEVVGALTARDLIRMARAPAAVLMLRRMKDAIGDWSGWVTRGEAHQADLLGAVLDDPGARGAWNRARIGTIKEAAGSDLEALARVFEDDELIDDGSVESRLTAVLGATQHLVIPGLQTGVEFSDTGFAGDQAPGGSGFRDPHPSSRNQPGHFLTAVGLEYSPATVSREIANWAFFCGAIGAPPEVRAANTIRAMVLAPAAMSDADVAVRLTIGHEKAPDPASGLLQGLEILAAGFVEDLLPGPERETEDEHDRRVGEAMRAETLRRVTSIITTFRTQFGAAADADVAAWNEALAALGNGTTLDLAAAEAPLGRIAIDPAGRGNSIQDLRLSLVGWKLGQLIAAGTFADGAAVATWIRTNLGGAAPGATPAAP